MPRVQRHQVRWNCLSNISSHCIACLTGQLDNLRRVHMSRWRRIRARSEPTEQAPHHVCVYSEVAEAHEAPECVPAALQCYEQGTRLA